MSADRNVPCPCGSGRKFKKCHGAAVPPEVAALPAPERERLQRAVQLIERDRRIHQELLDWCDRRLGPEWANAALDQFAGGPEHELSEYDESFYAHWLLHHRPASSTTASPAVQWLEAQRTRHGARMDADVDALLTAQRDSRIGLWRVTQVEAGVGYGLHDLLTGTTAFVYDDAGTLGELPDDVCLGYLLTLDDLQLILGTHLDLLPLDEAEQVAQQVRTMATVDTDPASHEQAQTGSAPSGSRSGGAIPAGRVSREFLADPLRHVRLRNLWHEHAASYWGAVGNDTGALHDGILDESHSTAPGERP